MKNNFAEILPLTRSYLPERFKWPVHGTTLDSLLETIQKLATPPFVFDLARIEWAVSQVAGEGAAVPENLDKSEVNSTLELFLVGWSGLPDLLEGTKDDVVPAEAYVAVYIPYGEHRVRVLEMSGHNLLAIKIIAENLAKRDIAESGGISVPMVDNILSEARREGLVHLPPSRLEREGVTSGEESITNDGMCAEIFTLQWHLTQQCDLSCRHCYDRSSRKEMSVEQAEGVLDQLCDFCEYHRVAGQVSFSGGNPLLYRHFDHVYRQAAERGFMTAILGNPTSRERLERLVAIRRPEFFQVSLEGLEEHNDYIRGRGHFRRTLTFLELLREFGIYSMVMLTLTRSNMQDVLPLAEFLRDKVDLFNFNRLSPVGEGAALETVPSESYPAFLEKYMQAAEDNPVMGLKDNLFNIIRDRRGISLTGGCTGFGCGAAFNFVSLLPDGEIHACRKFPSPIGNIHSSSLSEMYHSRLAGTYRDGSSSCRGCRIRGFCGGCLAVAYGSGRNPHTEVDPYCFISDK